MPKPGVRMTTDRPVARKNVGPIVRLTVGKVYTARKGSPLRIQWGPLAIYMVVSLPQVVSRTAIVHVLGPCGIALCYAADLRPCDEPKFEEE